MRYDPASFYARPLAYTVPIRTTGTHTDRFNHLSTVLEISQPPVHRFGLRLADRGGHGEAW